MEPCPEPKLQVKTNGDLADAVLALRGALRDCNDTKEALRVWSSTVKTNDE